MSFETANPKQASELLEGDTGYAFVDVRSVEEFEEGHVPGAYNVPLMFKSPFGMEPNPAFLETIQKLFAPDDKLVFG